MSEVEEESAFIRNALEIESGIRFEVKDGEDDKKKPERTIPFYKIFGFADFRDKVLMIVGTIAAIGNGLSQPLMSLIFGEVIDMFGEAQSHNHVSRASKVSLKFIYLALGCGVAAFLQVACWMVTGERQAARIRSLYLKTILQQEIAYFDNDVSTGEVTGSMCNATILIQDAIGEKVGKFVQVVVSFLGGFVIAFMKGWLLTLVMLTTIPLIVISSAVMHVVISRIASRAQRAHVNAANLVQQTIGNIRTVASFCGEKQAVVKYKKFLDSSYKCDLHLGLSIGIGAGFTFFMVLSSYGLAVWFGAKMIVHNGYTGGEVFTVLLSVIVGSSSLNQASPPLTAFAAAQAAALKVFETINRKSNIDAYHTKGKTLNYIHGDIELRDVCFSYPSRPSEQIFNGFSLCIPRGTSVAMVGQSGSGKSTVVSLIERFYDPQAGKVLIDGIDLREFQLKWIRSKIGLVSQEPVLFTASIKDNIAYGKDCATLDEIRAAAELANAIDFIYKLPQGLDTTVGENGIQISGGQKQRVAIARAILKNPQILLLDEATSALDAESERIVQDALDKIMVNRTTVVVAHRLSTIRNANVIALLHQGKIVEKGTHLELLKDPHGMYANLVSSQQLKEDLDTTIKSGSVSSGSSGAWSTSSHSMSNSTTNHLRLSVSKTAIANENVISPEKSQHHPEVSIFRLARLNKAEVPVLILGAMIAIMSGTMFPLVGLILSFAISTFYETPHKMQKDSEFWALMFVILGVAALIASLLRAYLFGLSGNKLIRRIRLRCFEKVINMEISWFDKPENSSGVIGTRLSSDAAMIRFLVGDALGQIVRDSASIVGGLAIAFQASWRLALIILALVPLIILNNYAQMKYGKRFSGDAKVMYEEASQIANDAVGNIRTVSSFCAQERIIETYAKKCEGAVANGTQQGLISGIGFGLTTVLLYSIYATCFYAGGQLIQHGNSAGSDVFRVFFALAIVGLAISTSTTFAAESIKAKSAAASIFAILDRKSRNDPSDESGMTLENFNGEIELSHVNFSYPTRPGVPILSHLSLTIHSGKIVALVGESGSGKSTVISLLQGFYDPDSGHIRLDGIDIQKFQLKWLRQQMGLVSQEPILFNDTIRANIAIGKGGRSGTEAEIVYAAKLANAHEFISGLQQGYDTIVGERGVQLSGGQKQRLAIARVILKSPKILLLDEATSALDAKSEKIFQEALDKVMLNRTTVIVAHRLSTIRGADKIAVLKNGSIVEKGNHNTLMNIKDGYYSSLVKLHKTAMS